jgi:hypothetical protein
MKRILAACLCAFAMQAHADWNATDIDEIVENVKNVKTNVTSIKGKIDGNISITADDLKRQLDDLQNRGVLIKSSVQEILVWLESRRVPFVQFKGTNCGAGTPCADFRVRLKRFAADMSSMADRFPAIEKVGLGDGLFAETVIDVLPPFVLFGFKQVMDRVAGWEEIPLDLIDVYNEIADPEAFSISFAEPAAADSRSANLQQQGVLATPTQKFCYVRAYRVDNPTDPVRLNRIKMAGFALKTAVDVWAEFSPDDIGGSLVGEGVYGVPTFVRAVLKGVKGAIEVIQAGVETYRQNLGICRSRLREIESHLVTCAEFAEYKQRTANDEAYDFVNSKVKEFGGIGFKRKGGTAQAFLDKAKDLRNEEKWLPAYRQLCKAYEVLGE